MEQAVNVQTSKQPHILEEFCENTTIHGLKYIADKERNWWERFVSHGTNYSIKCSYGQRYIIRMQGLVDFVFLDGHLHFRLLQLDHVAEIRRVAHHDDTRFEIVSDEENPLPGHYHLQCE